MTRQIEIPMTTTTSEQDISGSERLINVYPRESAGGKYKFNIINAPGLSLLSTLPTGPVLQLHNNGPRAFAVTETKFYEILLDGSYVELGDVALSGRVVMADNGSQIVAVDGIKGYYYDDTTNMVLEIVDPSFYPASHVTYQDGYFIFNRTGTSQFFISELLDVAFDPLDFASAEGQPDDLVAVLSDHRELFLFGTETIEVWYNSGDPTFPFERNQAAFVEKGCAARYTVAKQNNTVYFVGSDLLIYKMDGYTPVRISSHIIEETLKDANLELAYSYVYQEEGHLFYVITIPDKNITWCYDIVTAAWHIKSSYGLGRHRSNCAIFFGDKTFAGDSLNGNLYDMSRTTYLDNGLPIVREIVMPTLNNGREYLSVNSLELDMETGVGTVTGQGSDPRAMLQFSKDGGKTWSDTKFANIGQIGKFLDRVKWNRLGQARQFIFKINISDPVPLDIGGAFVEVN